MNKIIFSFLVVVIPLHLNHQKTNHLPNHQNLLNPNHRNHPKTIPNQQFIFHPYLIYQELLIASNFINKYKYF